MHTICGRFFVALVPLFVWAFALQAGAEKIDIQWGGQLLTDLRYRIESKKIGELASEQILPAEFSWNENRLSMELTVGLGDAAGLADIDFVWMGQRSEVTKFQDLQDRSRVQPYRLELHGLYVDFFDVIFEGLDIRLGQQIVKWGKADQFNPTDALNPMDLDDELYFGERLANMMLKIDFYGEDTWSFSLVGVPIFMPALMPVSASLGLVDIERLPFTNSATRYQLTTERDFARYSLSHQTVVDDAYVHLPKLTLRNMQAGARFAITLLNQDIALNYYIGRFDFPIAYHNTTKQAPLDEAICSPADATDCVNGTLLTSIDLKYVAMQLVGLNIAGEIPWLAWVSDTMKPLGYWFELAVVFPHQQFLSVHTETVTLAGRVVDGPYFDNRDSRSEVVPKTPFAKWVLGVDYSFTADLYMNLQWVHGMPDEYGAGDFFNEGWVVRESRVTDPSDTLALMSCAISYQFQPNNGKGDECVTEKLLPRLGDYLVMGFDWHFLRHQALLRMFAIFALNGVTQEQFEEDAGNDEGSTKRTHLSFFSSGGFSAVLYPQLDYHFTGGIVASVGALIKLGKNYTKFGDPAAGGSLVWMRARYAF